VKIMKNMSNLKILKTMKYNRDLRNKVGMVLAFVLGVLFSGLGMMVMALREQWQSKKGGFQIEADDLYRYSLCSGAGAVVNALVLYLIMK